MKAKPYEAPETDVIVMSFLESVCQGPSVPNYHNRTDIDILWDEDE